MSLVKTIEEIITYLPVAESMELSSITPFINQAERDYLIPAISQAEYDSLSVAYNVATPALSPAQSALLARCQAVVAPYAFMLWMPTGQLLISDAGIRIANTDTHKTAFQWQIDKLASSLLKQAGSALDALLSYMETNKASYTSWTASTSYTEFKDCFITTAAKFTELYSALGGSHRNFMAIRSAMKKEQDFTIAGALGDDFYLELKSENKTPASASKALVIPYIQRALAPLTMARAFRELVVSIDERGVVSFDNTGSSQTTQQVSPAKAEAISKLEKAALEDGAAYLQKLKEFLATNIADYSTYADSDAYDGDTTDQTFKNDSDATTFSFT